MGKKNRRNLGFHTLRWKDNPEEERLALWWQEINERGKVLAHLLDNRPYPGVSPPAPDLASERVAATVIQWLGSPVGQMYLRDLGYVRKE